MLESMIENAIPTRAEVADITVAVRVQSIKNKSMNKSMSNNSLLRFTGRARWSIVSTYDPKEVLVSLPAYSATNLLTSGATNQHAYASPKDPGCG
eukprot:3749642-Pyramimonas_sp.AAC.2